MNQTEQTPQAAALEAALRDAHNHPARLTEAELRNVAFSRGAGWREAMDELGLS
jgi:hypothetical protein